MPLLLSLVFTAFIITSGPLAADTLPPLSGNSAPSDFQQMWAGFDPQAEPLETEILHEWTEDDVILKIVRFRIGVFKGVPARLAAVYGYPKSHTSDAPKLPGLLQIHGGGQYADHKACLANAKHGYATLSIAWAGRISAPNYRVSPREVQLFWDEKTDDAGYRLTTDWGVVDGYHAPGRNAGNQFPSAAAADWTLDSVESPRNSGWFLCALAARRALTFLEQQPEVDADRLGVYGHSMGGKLTVMTAVDSRVTAAAPSCGGISDRDNKSPLFCSTLGDDVSLREIRCPLLFLSPANDFHGRIGDLPDAVNEIQSTDWRVTCSPHHNHQDTPEFEAATLLWFDQHLQREFEFPKTPNTTLRVDSKTGVPVLTIHPDTSRSIESIDVYYTQQGKADETPFDRLDTMHRFWHHAAPARIGDNQWNAPLPLGSAESPLWVFANVRYKLDTPARGVGYYYGEYETNSLNLSSLLIKRSSEWLKQHSAKASLDQFAVIEDFQSDWEKEWFTYRPDEWARSCNKLGCSLYRGPDASLLSLTVVSEQPNQLVIRLDDHVAEVTLNGGAGPQTIEVALSDFTNYSGEALDSWSSVRLLKLSPAEHLRPGRGESGDTRRVGKHWRGPDPEFRLLKWVSP